MRISLIIILNLLIISTYAQTSVSDVLAGPFASDLTATDDGTAIAWVDNAAGERNIFVASGEGFNTVKQITGYEGDEGIALGDLHFTPDGKYIVFVRGNTKNRSG